MSTALRNNHMATKLACTVADGLTTIAGMPVKFANAAGEIELAGADDDGIIGYAEESVGASDTERRINIYLLGPVIPVPVGTGGATLGSKAIVVAGSGYTDAPAHDSDGAGNESIVGIFMQTGVVGDKVGMQILHFSRGSAS